MKPFNVVLATCLAAVLVGPSAPSLAWSEDGGGAAELWSFQPIQRPPIPQTARSDWVRNPIDAFVLARLEAAGQSPARPAAATSLVRRLNYATTGLPPTPAAVQRFQRLTTDDEYAAWVDQLLASPAYGEHWARHWLDLVRFAESNSYERDDAKPQAWRYRDYVIRAFNEDKPFDEFVVEQLAGDELPEPSAAQIIATGYYRLGMWDDEPSDPVQALYDDLDDILTTTSQVFLGLTMNCARCHDHKIDPLSQHDYYRFLAFFNGIHRYGGPAMELAEGLSGRRDLSYSLRPIVPPEELAAHEAAVAEHRAEMDRVKKELDELANSFSQRLGNGDRDDFAHPSTRLDVIEKNVPETFSEDELEQYRGLVAEQKELENHTPPTLAQALCVTELGPTPRDTFVHRRGSPHAPGDAVTPGFPKVLGFDDPEIRLPDSGTTSGRRMALARWIAQPHNPLTARVIVNRVWQQHFGEGLVRTPNDFGVQGDAPSHPELLDWLASEFVASGWRFKTLHRLILTSATFRQASDDRQGVDPENRLYGRYPLRRLTAEQIRDSILSCSGSLNPAMHGASIYPEIPAEVLAGQSRPGNGWDTSQPTDAARRSVYIFVKRSLIVPIIASFDGADTDFTCPQRFSTTQPTQALGLLNGDFVQREARHFADRLRKENEGRLEDMTRAALWQVLQRPPTAAEVARGTAFVESLARDSGLDRQAAFVQFCVLALNLNEFVYLD